MNRMQSCAFAALLVTPLAWAEQPVQPLPSVPVSSNGPAVESSAVIGQEYAPRPISGPASYHIFGSYDDALGADKVSQLYYRNEMLFWWTKRSSLPTLLTTTTGPIFNDLLDGALGIPDTVPLVGGKDLDQNFRQGGRFVIGGWFDACQKNGAEVSFFFLGPTTEQISANSGTFPSLFRPFNAPNAGIEGVNAAPVFIAPNTGSFVATTRSSFLGSDLLYRSNCVSGSNGRFDVLTGFRYLNLRESLKITTRETLAADEVDANGNLAPFGGQALRAGTQIDTADRFNIDNNFYGGLLGGAYRYYHDKWTIDVRTSVSLGCTHVSEQINGYQIVSPPTTIARFVNGGLLAQGSNSGHFGTSKFAVVPEVGLNVNYQVCSYLKASVGYNYLYWSDVARVGNALPTQIDAARVPNLVADNSGIARVNPAQPTPPTRRDTTDFWAQGVTVGLEWQW